MERLWALVMGVELKPQNLVATDGTITDPPATGLGSISNGEDKDRILYINSLSACVRACVRVSVRRDSSAL